MSLMLLNLYASINSVMQKWWLRIQDYLKYQCQMCFFIQLWAYRHSYCNNHLLLSKVTYIKHFVAVFCISMWRQKFQVCILHLYPKRSAVFLVVTLFLPYFLIMLGKINVIILIIYIYWTMWSFWLYIYIYWTSWYFSSSTMKNVRSLQCIRIANNILTSHEKETI